MTQKSTLGKSVVTWSILFGLVLLTNVTSPGADNAEKQVAAIKAALEQYVKAYESGDGDKMVDFFTDDVIYMADGQPTASGDGFKA